MNVRELMSTPVITVGPSASIQEVASIMRQNGISAVPVVAADSSLVGIVTEVDLITRHAPPRQPSYFPLLWGLIPMRLDDYADYKAQVRHILAVNAEQLMTEDPQTVAPDASVAELAEIMIQPGHSSIPVMENGTLVGIVTRTDLVQVIEDLELGQE